MYALFRLCALFWLFRTPLPRHIVRRKPEARRDLLTQLRGFYFPASLSHQYHFFASPCGSRETPRLMNTFPSFHARSPRSPVMPHAQHASCSSLLLCRSPSSTVYRSFSTDWFFSPAL